MEAALSVTLRDGSTVADRRLDRLPQFDPRNLNYPIRTLLGPRKPRSYTWRCSVWFDQKDQGECVGYSLGHEVAARPVEAPIDPVTIHRLYRRAQDLDEWPGSDYSGTSVLAGVKAYAEAGYYGGYRWATSVEDVFLSIGWQGPVVLGINWYEGMMNTDSRGFISPTGSVVGGHAICAIGVSVSTRTIRLRNSWGRGWGRDGDALVSEDDLAVLLGQADAECCVPVQRLRGPR